MISLRIVSSLTVTNWGEIFCFVFTVNKDFFFNVFPFRVMGFNQGSWDFRITQAWNCPDCLCSITKISPQTDQPCGNERAVLSLRVQFLTFPAWPSKRRVPQIWWGLCEVDPGGEILTSAGSIFHLKSLETDPQIISKDCSFHQMVVGWLSFTTDLGQTWTRDQEMKGSISHYQ